VAGNLAKWPVNIPTTSTARPSSICPNFWFKNIPSGKPGEAAAAAAAAATDNLIELFHSARLFGDTQGLLIRYEIGLKRICSRETYGCRESSVTRRVWEKIAPNVAQPRVVRWYTFKPKISICVNFGGPSNGKGWYVIRPSGIYCGHLVYIFYGHLAFSSNLVHFPPFWYIVSRKIWQPWHDPFLSK
jgi:hypothetical protein